MGKIRAHDMVFRKSFNYNLKPEQRKKVNLKIKLSKRGTQE